MSSKKKSKNSTKKMWTVIYILLVIACFLCIALMAVYLMDKKKQAQDAQEKYEEIVEQVVEPEPTEPVVPEEEEKAELPIDFAALQEINPEIYAWLRIPDTNVDYPILQREDEDQSFYLTHDMYGEAQKAGSIYTENYNSKDFHDPNTIIYGHNMKDGSMFHNLRYFAEQEFFDEHEEMYIYMPGKVLRYQIFASYEFDDRHLLGSYNFEDEEVFADYIEEITNPRSMYMMLREDCELTVDDRIVTLSTCVANKPNNRRLVQAVLVEELDAEYRGAADGEVSEETQGE